MEAAQGAQGRPVSCKHRWVGGEFGECFWCGEPAPRVKRRAVKRRLARARPKRPKGKP